MTSLLPNVRPAWPARLAVLAAALWWGSLTAIGFLAVPLLFSHLPAATAGQTAARLFSAQSFVSLTCGVLILLILMRKQAATREKSGSTATILIVTGLWLALVLEYAVAPRIAARVDLALWHPVGTTLYALQWACALALLWRLASGAAAGGQAVSPDAPS